MTILTSVSITTDIKEFEKNFETPDFVDAMATMKMTRIGTPFYMAPEIHNEVYDERVDCFAWAKMGLRCHKICDFITRDFSANKITENQMSKRFLVAIKNALTEDPEDRSNAKKILDDLGVDIRDGEGKKEFPDGKVYVGSFRRCKMNGQGRLEWPDGTYYEGAFKNDVRSGEAVMKWPDGRKFTGRFENDMKNGLGEMIWPDKKYKHHENASPIPGSKDLRRKSYVGMFQNDQINGQGKLIYYNTHHQHEGKFEDNAIKGPGKRTYIDGIWKGISIEGEFDNLETKGAITVNNGDSKYVGPIKMSDIKSVLDFMKDTQTVIEKYT